MKSSRLLAIGILALLLASCGKSAQISGTVSGVSKDTLVVKVLAGSKYEVVDTVRTDASGAFSYRLKLDEGQPEFVYVFRGADKLVSLIAQCGDKISFEADTLGNWTVDGSEECVKLQEVEKDFAMFMDRMANEDNPQEAMAEYIKYYRNSVKYVMSNPHSLTVVPVLYHEVSEDFPVFNQVTDALFFEAASDSLAAVYPDSKYVKILKKDAYRRGELLNVNTQLGLARTIGFPDLEMPDVNGVKVRLSDVDAKVVIVYFWTARNDEQKMSNLDFLIPLYEEYHDKGLEIYAVSLDIDKSVWAGAVKSQKLPWINVNDGRGPASPSVGLYGVDVVPKAAIIVNGEIAANVPANTEAEFRAFLSRNLK